MIRWHAELYIDKSKSPDAVWTSADKHSATVGIMHYVLTMVRPNEDFKITVKKIML